jgi:hypothetical protein
VPWNLEINDDGNGAIDIIFNNSLNVNSAVALNMEAKMRLQLASIKVMKKEVKC